LLSDDRGDNWQAAISGQVYAKLEAILKDPKMKLSPVLSY